VFRWHLCHQHLPRKQLRAGGGFCIIYWIGF
jgi:hypothetical protein